MKQEMRRSEFIVLVKQALDTEHGKLLLEALKDQNVRVNIIQAKNNLTNWMVGRRDIVQELDNDFNTTEVELSEIRRKEQIMEKQIAERRKYEDDQYLND